VQKTKFLTSSVLVGVLLLAPMMTYGQSYEKLSKAIAKLDSTLKVMVEKQKRQQPASQQIADVEGVASLTPESDRVKAAVSEPASNPEKGAGQLHGVAPEAKEGEKNRPQEAAPPKHGVSASTVSSGPTADQATVMLKDGNQRFASHQMKHPNGSPERRQEVVAGQNPFATVLSCSDSRVPVEYIFDAGLGDIFVVRVAGNVADVDEIGTIEYGAGHLKTPLLVVMGHSGCGAVTAVATGAEVGGSIPQLVDNIIPAVKTAEKMYPDLHGKDLVPEAIKANIWQSIQVLYQHSPEVSELVNSGSLKVVGALYHLEDGCVEWLGPHPNQRELVAEGMQFFGQSGEQSDVHGEKGERVSSPATQQLADAEGVAGAMARPINDVSGVSELAANLEEVVAQLQGVVTEAKEAEKSRPQNLISSSHGKIAFAGVFHEQYYTKDGEPKTSSFDTRYALLGVSGSINQWAKVTFWGNFAKTPTLIDAYASIMPNKYWTLDFGQYKPPFGADFLKSASAVPFCTNFKGQSLGTVRDVGADASLNYQWKNGNAIKVTGGIYNGAPYNTSDVNNDKNFIGRVEVKLAKMFTFAPNLIAGKSNDPDSTKKNLDVWGGSLNWSWKNEIIEGEYIHNQTGSTEKQGWHVWGAHTFSTGLKFVPELQMLARYEQLDLNMNKTGDRTDRVTFGTNLYIDKKYTKLQINYQVNGEETKSVDNNEWLVNLQVAF
jgi:carbonic anhydrase